MTPSYDIILYIWTAAQFKALPCNTC